MMEIMEEYGGTLLELMVAIVILLTIINMFFVPIGETSAFKEYVQLFIESLIGA